MHAILMVYMSPPGVQSYPMHFTYGYGNYDADTTQDGMLLGSIAIY